MMQTCINNCMNCQPSVAGRETKCSARKLGLCTSVCNLLVKVEKVPEMISKLKKCMTGCETESVLCDQNAKKPIETFRCNVESRVCLKKCPKNVT